MVAFLGGILTSLTPCIFPMLPITLGVIGAKNTKSKFQAFTLSVTYVLGIALTYSTLGVVAGLTGSIFGSTLQSPLIVSAISILFFIMGLSMFDMFFVQVPLSLQNKLSKVYGSQDKTNYLGVAFMGLISGLIATPCVGPVIVSMLTYISQTKNAFLGFWLLFSFALGMGLLLILFGTFSNLLTNMPRAGAWMETIKKVMGFAMMGVAFYYIRPVLPVHIFTLLLGSFMIFTSVFLGLNYKLDQTSSNSEKISKGLSINALVLGLFLLINSLASKELLGNNLVSLNVVEKTSTKIESNTTKEEINWEKSEIEGLKKAKAEGKFMVIDFYADWCPSCIELDKYTYTNKEVIAEMSNLITVKIDATKTTDETNNLFSKYGIVGLPAVIFLDKNGKVLEALTLTGFEKPDKFLARLKKLKEIK